MEFEGQGKRRLLLKNGLKIKVGDSQIVEYTGVYYKDTEYSTKFIGMVECAKIRNSETIGIYVKPLYMYLEKWYKVKYQPPKEKYFLYPHLLTLQNNDGYKAIHLDTISEAELPNTDLEMDL